ncbi:gamma-glutamylcyclotransferase [Zavarzinia compransoris]|uniref:glutathione-specific gamma-glutamylcyclotransferase n=1 Tax=Zavarzinia compransoris TaxID=1264899 RepID=A0A317DWV5_9PROT|nr:gamma-glutamylcyclotransferase [Zavarzinia compransoris]PWR18922.1 gamma-glutamylcyclotransferase [Zavarzinia compransoris]TDP48918.1 cation transport protein ChaC [Zavarzinia compransoris]
MAAAGDCWVFAYGSLIWRPGFAFLEAVPATLHGYHRAFCIYSHHYRGTPERRGLVLGLARGGSCRGMAFRVAADAWAETLGYLRERELVTNVYKERLLPVRLAAGVVEAVTYVADPGHEQYARGLTFEDQVRMIAGAAGIAGRNRDYLAATVQEMERLGLGDGVLHRLNRAVQALPEAPLGEHEIARHAG